MSVFRNQVLGGRTATAVLIVLLALGVAACGDDDKPVVPNVAPSVSFVQRPADGARVGESAIFRWTAFDPDGRIVGYQTQIDARVRYTAAGDTSMVVTFTRADGTDSRPASHTFTVRGVDNEGDLGAPASATFLVAVFNQPPSVALNTFPPVEGYIGPTAHFTWGGFDPDGTVVGYEFTFGDTAGTWTATADTSLTVDFSTGGPVVPSPRDRAFSPLNRPVEYTFFLRAIDNDDKRSPIVRTTFLSGPANVPPTVALIASPDEPPFVVAKEATWSWLAEDSDGDILRVQYAVDLDAPTDWRRWDDDAITIEFTRADGTAENPALHTFFLRAQDNDSTYSAVVTRDFLVGVANQPPTIQLTQYPQPGATVTYNFTYKWSGQDDTGIDRYEYAVDDTVNGQGQSTWVSTTATSAALVFSATAIENPATCGAVGCLAFGEHRFFVRCFDKQGLVSRTLASDIRCVNRTPVSTVVEPAPAGDGSVAGTTAFTFRWTVTDLETANQRTTSSYVVREVDDFAEFPDAEAAVTDLPAGTTWTAYADAKQASVTLESGKLYIVGVRSRDEAAATDGTYVYGRNVIKVTVP